MGFSLALQRLASARSGGREKGNVGATEQPASDASPPAQRREVGRARGEGREWTGGRALLRPLALTAIPPRLSLSRPPARPPSPPARPKPFPGQPASSPSATASSASSSSPPASSIRGRPPAPLLLPSPANFPLPLPPRKGQKNTSRSCMPAQLSANGPPRRPFASSSSQDYEEGHFQQGRDDGHGHGSSSGAGWQEANGGDAFLGSSAGKATGAGMGLGSGLEHRGSASTRKTSGSAPAGPPFNTFGRRAPSPQPSTPLGSVLALASNLKSDLLSSAPSGVVGNVKCASARWACWRDSPPTREPKASRADLPARPPASAPTNRPCPPPQSSRSAAFGTSRQPCRPTRASRSSTRFGSRSRSP